MAQQTVYHVVPSGEEWAVKKEGASQASRVAATQRDAIDYAETFARRQAPSRVVIHGEDGTITGQHSFSETQREESPWLSVLTTPPVLTGLAIALGVTGVAWFLASRD
jgi:hypothetical protein